MNAANSLRRDEAMLVEDGDWAMDTNAYVTSRFLLPDTVASLSGVGLGELRALIDAGCLPGHSYTLFDNGALWSPIATLGAIKGHSRRFYSRAVLSWIRRAMAFGGRPGAALAADLRGWLREDIALALRRPGTCPRDWPDVFTPDGMLDGGALDRAVVEIWGDWSSGAYGVCLRHFDGHHLVTKTVERARVARLLDAADKAPLSASRRIALVDAASRLDSVLMPFAPHERRPGSTRALVDQAMAR